MSVCKICGKKSEMPFHTCNRSYELAPTINNITKKYQDVLSKIDPHLLNVRMEPAEKWAGDINDGANSQGGFDTIDDITKWIEQIQLDAWKQGMGDAAKIVSTYLETQEISEAHKEICFYRDHKTSL